MDSPPPFTPPSPVQSTYTSDSSSATTHTGPIGKPSFLTSLFNKMAASSRSLSDGDDDSDNDEDFDKADASDEEESDVSINISGVTASSLALLASPVSVSSQGAEVVLGGDLADSSVSNKQNGFERSSISERNSTNPRRNSANRFPSTPQLKTDQVSGV